MAGAKGLDTNPIQAERWQKIAAQGRAELHNKIPEAGIYYVEDYLEVIWRS